jgi:hypothetical protein
MCWLVLRLIFSDRCVLYVSQIVSSEVPSNAATLLLWRALCIPVKGFSVGITRWRGLSPAMPMLKGFRSRERIGDLANSTTIRRKQRNTRIYPGSAPSKGKRPTSCLSDFVLMRWWRWWCYNDGVDWIYPKQSALSRRALRREVGGKYLGFRDLPPSLLYVKAGSRDCLSSQVQIGSLHKRKPNLSPILRVLACTPSLAPGPR